VNVKLFYRIVSIGCTSAGHELTIKNVAYLNFEQGVHTYHVISCPCNDNSACLWELEVWDRISQKPNIEAWFQRSTNRKRPMVNRMVTWRWPMSSR